MGKSEDFSPQYVQREKAEREKREAYAAKKAAALKQEQERKEKERAIFETRMEEVMSMAIHNFSIDLTLEKFGEISGGNEEGFQKLKNAIKLATIAYLEKNPEVKENLYKKGMAERNTQEIIKKELRNIYFSEIKDREPMGREEEKFEEVVRNVLKKYLATQNLGPQKSGLIDVGALERREKMAEEFIRSIAMKFFKENTLPPKEKELSDLVKKSLEV